MQTTRNHQSLTRSRLRDSSPSFPREIALGLMSFCCCRKKWRSAGLEAASVPDHIDTHSPVENSPFAHIHREERGVPPAKLSEIPPGDPTHLKDPTAQ